MTIEAPPRLEPEVQPPLTPPAVAAAPPATVEALPAPASADELAPPSLLRTGIAAFLVTASAAWMVGGVFDGWVARPLGVIAAAVAVGCIIASYLLQRGQFVRLGFIVVTVVAASLASAAGGGQLSPVDAVTTSLSNGGLLQPPVPFDPGWRFILVALVACLGAGTTSLVAAGRRPRLSLMLPLPVIAGAALVQPPSNAVLDAVISLVLVVIALMVLISAEQAGNEAGSRSFELRRLGRGTAALAAATAGLIVLNQTNALFPGSAQQRTIPPQKPQVTPLTAVKEVVLFTVTVPKGDSTLGPWRLGDLDVYDGQNFLLPPYDTSRFVPVGSNMAYYRGHGDTVTFSVAGLASRLLPDVSGTEDVNAHGEPLSWDPRTQTFIDRATPNPGYTYSVTAVPSPSSDDMSAAPAPQGDFSVDLQVPPPPAQVQTLLRQAPMNPYERMQALRVHLLNNVLAAGPGQPVPVTSADVVGMLNGARASPYQIAAAQVILARWAGVPARLGYGFYNGTKANGTFSIFPRDGANWLEAYFQGYGWVPIIGQPLHAVSTLSSSPKNQIVALPSQQISLELYVPVDVSGALQLYEFVRYYALIILPFVIAAVLAVVFFPWPLKVVRRRRRRRWAQDGQLNLQIAVEYAELRDLATDLHAGNIDDTPLEFTQRLAPDEEHEELAWLVTRGLWGDLQRDLQPEDATAAREMGDSLRRRLSRGQTLTTRLLALASRASLREPHDASMPNLWPQQRLRRAWRPRRRRRTEGAVA